eukprot:10369115-Alexandrium_andersonii.AAC.1
MLREDLPEGWRQALEEGRLLLPAQQLRVKVAPRWRYAMHVRGSVASSSPAQDSSYLMACPA